MKKISFKNVPISLKNNEQGATAIEYGLIAALLAVAAITAINALGADEHANKTVATVSAALK